MTVKSLQIKDNIGKKTDRWKEGKRNVKKMFLKIRLIRFFSEKYTPGAVTKCSHIFFLLNNVPQSCPGKKESQQETTILSFVY